MVLRESVYEIVLPSKGSMNMKIIKVIGSVTTNG